MRFLRHLAQFFRLGQSRQAGQSGQAGQAGPAGQAGQAGPAGQAGQAGPVRLAFYNTYDARLWFSHLLRRAARGEEIVIARSGVPIAKLVPYTGERLRPGLIRTHVRVVPPDDEHVLGATPIRSSRAAST
jgi:antitoxin (DNA-binding transcriptional repressor) of toxin-antitoxin stability system